MKTVRWIAAGFALAAVAPASVRADDATAEAVTYYKHVAPIVQANCADCHRQSGTNLGGVIAPMPMTTYEEVRPWAKSIARVVESREMPPWHASPAFHGVFSNERTLTEEEIATILRWVNAGAPMGNPADAPPAPSWPEGSWSIGEPDLVVSFEKPFLVKDHVDDLNTNIFVDITEEMLPEDKYITRLEFKPGSEVVHHILGFIIPPRESGESFQMLGGIAPGSTPTVAPDGYGIKLHKGSRFLFQMHYNKEKGPGTAVEDVSSVAFVFADKPVHRLYVEAIGDPGALRIPPNTPDIRFTSKRKWDRDFVVAGYAPHMHLRGYYSEYKAVLPDGGSEVLLETPAWHFDWQMSYSYAEPKRFPAGTILEVTMGYNNTAEKEGNPDPNVEVTFGPATWDEMNLGWLTWGYAEPTDHDPVPRAIGGGNDDLPRPEFKRERQRLF